MSEENTYYSTAVLLDRVITYMIWVSSDNDFVVTIKPGRLAAFEKPDTLTAYANKNGIEIQPDQPHKNDIDAVLDWLALEKVIGMDCAAFLNIWNLLADICSTLDLKLYEPEGSQEIYDKLFFGNNLPAMTPKDEVYVPEWSVEEIKLLANVFRDGTNKLRNGISIVG